MLNSAASGRIVNLHENNFINPDVRDDKMKWFVVKEIENLVMDVWASGAIACSSLPLPLPSVSGRSSSISRDLHMLLLGLEREREKEISITMTSLPGLTTRGGGG